MTVESVSTSEAQLEGSNRWYSIVVRGASGKDIRQLFERQGALVSRVLRISVGTLKLRQESVARPAPAVDRCGDLGSPRPGDKSAGNRMTERLAAGLLVETSAPKAA